MIRLPVATDAPMTDPRPTEAADDLFDQACGWYFRLQADDLTPAEAALWRLLRRRALDGRRFRRQFSVGGQGIGINKYSKKLPELVKFMEWYFQPEQQKRYAAVCQTGLKAVLESPAWHDLNSYNAQFSQSQESAADDYSFDLLTEKKMSRQGLVTSFQKLAKLSAGNFRHLFSRQPQ